MYAALMIVFVGSALSACAHSPAGGPALVTQLEDAFLPGLPRAGEQPNVRRFAAPSARSAAFERLYGREDRPLPPGSAPAPLSERLAGERTAPNVLQFRF